MKKLVAFASLFIVLLTIFYLLEETFVIEEIHTGEDEFPIVLRLKSNKLVNPSYKQVDVFIEADSILINKHGEEIEHSKLNIDSKVKVTFSDQLIKVLPYPPRETAKEVVLIE
ncbi:hypothetical protein [Evansella cellulosilytica]|uniref:DUF3221 domain-containing protein n=1 Tax=Evansella cellulosilytica (strain ATCC 21833 / DSM 2522 / FERM P-1141 / JCM 9156 / N-4) TaxID=649639 RepID=E6TX12_EVAC2|nr:hypothetical protein [Evansella cellulosilytica]ADU31101.1 hypothetical protein Bcell_2848 [Evansella cellulosilytica DSM 2522]